VARMDRLNGPNNACTECGRVLRLDAVHAVCVRCRRAAGERGQTKESRSLYRRVKYAMKHRENEAARRAQKLGQFVEYVDPAVVWARDSGICHICQTDADPDDWHLEHVVALVNGGEHSYANTAVSHPFCNLSKGAK
jgi:hypothetical protein